MLPSGAPGSGSYPTSATAHPATDPVACPYLGLPDDPRSRFVFATPAHRCYAKRKPAELDIEHQGRYCLSDQFVSCPRYHPVTTPIAAPNHPVPDGRSTETAAKTDSVISILDTVRPAIEQLDRVRGVGAADPGPPAFGDLARGPIPSILKPVPEPEASPPEALPAEAPHSPKRSVDRRFTLLIAVAIVAVVILVTFGPTIRLLLSG